MGARKPGPICVTNSEPIDTGTRCRKRSQPPGPIGLNPFSASKVAPKISFAILWAGYPSSKPVDDVENQCAIKVSIALHAAGVDMDSFDGANRRIHGKIAATRAEELAKWLNRQHFPWLSKAVDVTGEDWQEKIKGKTGVVFFKDYWLRQNETRNPTGDHIDLWNGSKLTATGLGGHIVTFLRFTLGVNSGPGFSDLGKAKNILFWEVK